MILKPYKRSRIDYFIISLVRSYAYSIVLLIFILVFAHNRIPIVYLIGIPLAYELHFIVRLIGFRNWERGGGWKRYHVRHLVSILVRTLTKIFMLVYCGICYFHSPDNIWVGSLVYTVAMMLNFMAEIFLAQKIEVFFNIYVRIIKLSRVFFYLQLTLMAKKYKPDNSSAGISDMSTYWPTLLFFILIFPPFMIFFYWSGLTALSSCCKPRKDGFNCVGGIYIDLLVIGLGLGVYHCEVGIKDSLIYGKLGSLTAGMLILIFLFLI